MKTREAFISQVIEALELAGKGESSHDRNSLEGDGGKSAFEKLHFDFPVC